MERIPECVGQSSMKGIYIVVIPLVAILLLSLILYLFWIDKHEDFVYEPTIALMDTINRAVFLGDQHSGVERRAHSILDCTPADLERLPLSANYGQCSMTSFTRPSDYCAFWWLGRNCISIKIRSDLFEIPQVRSAMKQAITAPCQFIQGRNSPNWNSLRCYKDSNYQHYDVVVVLLNFLNDRHTDTAEVPRKRENLRYFNRGD